MIFSRKRIQFFIFLFDLVFLFLSLLFALIIRNQSIPNFEYYYKHIPLFIPDFICWIVVMYTMNLYSIDVYNSFSKTFLRMIIAAGISTLVGFAAFYLFGKSITPKTVLLLHTSIFLILDYLWHSLSKFIFSNKFTHSNYAFIGYNNTVKEILNMKDSKFFGNFIPKAIFASNTTINNENIPCFNNLENFKKQIDKYNIDTFILCPEYELSKDISEFLFNELNNFAIFYSLPDFFELIARKIPLGSINETWILTNTSYRGKFIYHTLKRIFDLLFSIILTPFLIIIFPLTALIIKLESKGPVFFIQKRLGQNGKIFNLYKFRTMRTENNDGAYTTKNDSRITKFGSFMRKTRIDELPQLLNILKGDMSLIGPRPERPELAEDLQRAIPYYNQRLIVKPGITGWDQASGEYHSPSVEDTYKKLQNDLYYVKNQSLALDFSIFFKTIRTVFAKEGM